MFIYFFILNVLSLHDETLHLLVLYSCLIMPLKTVFLLLFFIISCVEHHNILRFIAGKMRLFSRDIWFLHLCFSLFFSFAFKLHVTFIFTYFFEMKAFKFLTWHLFLCNNHVVIFFFSGLSSWSSSVWCWIKNKYTWKKVYF